MNMSWSDVDGVCCEGSELEDEARRFSCMSSDPSQVHLIGVTER